MTPAQIKALRTQLALSQGQFAAALNGVDPLMRCAQNTVSRWEVGTRTPDIRSTDALTRLWLHEGYPVTVTMHDGTERPGTLTTDSSASSYGQPVIVIDGTAHGSGDVASVDLGDAPASMVERARSAGYAVP